MLRRSIPACLGVLGMLMAGQAMSSISLSATRIVFDGNHKEANVTVRNGNQDVLIQSWVDHSDAQRSIPFAVTPALARVFAREQQLLRVLYEGAGVPVDKESMVWLNVQEIPQAAAAANTLQLAVRQRIKIFFRPAGLPGNALMAPTELQWQLLQQSGRPLLQVKNPSLYHVSMADIKLETAKQSELAVDSTMVAPGEVKTFPIKTLGADNNVRLSFFSINDYGAQNKYTTTLSSGQTSTATEAPNKQ
ncbi:Chaperone protein EcpD precursor [compost metagenome]|uniref:fimbrial biogenesis chaperone n=1 Tax=Pseudomonas TaxID=286 RepID=UPI000CFDB56E|nr:MULTISPECIES: fimbria/pilus periplasmic chaperone [unclassified Pseudomonas]MCW2268204.1 P pilus assembly chaperone PapD [Pseudomonas sp. JUb96]PRA67935.1 pilus assembly protein [Pseudomonas sp. MYb187]